jgi:hypothetical protein
MKEHRCYIRTILLSVLAAFVIDAIVNFEDYQEGWLVGVKQEKLQEREQPRELKLPVKIGKVTGAIYQFVF